MLYSNSQQPTATTSYPSTRRPRVSRPCPPSFGLLVECNYAVAMLQLILALVARSGYVSTYTQDSSKHTDTNWNYASNPAGPTANCTSTRPIFHCDPPPLLSLLSDRLRPPRPKAHKKRPELRARCPSKCLHPRPVLNMIRHASLLSMQART